MYPTTTADSLRLRYRQPAGYKQRAVQPDIIARRPATRQMVTTPMQPTQRTEPTMPSNTAAAQPSHFQLHLQGVPVAPITRSRYLVKPRRGLQYCLMGMGIILFALGSYVSYMSFQSNQAVGEVLAREQTSGTQAAPVVVAPSANDLSSYQVGPDMPRYISIESLGIKARVKSLGVNVGGQIASPSNVHDAGWYNGSSKPGTTGAALIDGHVSSWTTNGIFYNLKSIKAGATVQIEKGDGTVLTYRVIKTEVAQAETVNMRRAMTPVTSGKQGLNLITCTGKVKPGTSEFEQRLIVYTERVS